MACGCSSPTENYDVVFIGGRVIDPETNLDGVRSVAIKDGRIAKVAKEPLTGDETIDISGLVLAPGFIDLHAHGQHRVAQELQAQDGVTTAMEMELGAYPIQEFYEKREGNALIHFGATVSHKCIRLKAQHDVTCPDPIDILEGKPNAIGALGAMFATQFPKPENRPLNSAELQKLRELTQSELNHGALGLGLGIEYVPGASRAEIYSIFVEASKVKAPVFVHVRRRPLDDAPGVPMAVAQEVIANAAATGAPLQLVHVASTGLSDTKDIVDLIAQAQKQGLDITAEVYPYTAGGNTIGTNMLSEGWRERFNADYSDIAWIATGERLTAATFAKYREEQPDGGIILHVIPEDGVDYAIAHPAVSIASDGLVWMTGKEHPRGAGSFARVLGKYVREDELLSLPQAIRKMTLMPAQRMQDFAPAFAKKGRIQKGADADITIFDPKTVKDRATFTDPMQPSKGIQHVMVGGTFVVRDGILATDVNPGHGIKNRLATAVND
ncbi:MAG: amidohydrolase family protein [Pseudomonadota bacterium]